MKVSRASNLKALGKLAESLNEAMSQRSGYGAGELRDAHNNATAIERAINTRLLIEEAYRASERVVRVDVNI